MKQLLTALLIITAISAIGQTNKYKSYTVCIQSEVHKGKLNHGKSYCVAWADVNEYKDGHKDTVGTEASCRSYIGDEYEKYQKLPERGKYIVDSLKEDGITQLQQSYLTYEPIYMKAGKKVEQFWSIEGTNVVMYQYLFWNNSSGAGVKLLKEFKVN